MGHPTVLVSLRRRHCSVVRGALSVVRCPLSVVGLSVALVLRPWLRSDKRQERKQTSCLFSDSYVDLYAKHPIINHLVKQVRTKGER